MPSVSIAQSIEAYLDAVALSRSVNTTRTYRNALAAFTGMLESKQLDLNQIPARKASENWIADFAHSLKSYAPASESLYLSAVTGWYEYLAAEDLASINLPRVRMLIRQRGRRPGQRLPQFPRRDIERVLEYAQKLTSLSAKNDRLRLITLRDRAMLLTLADTGLRVHEACNLRRGDVDWHEGRAVIVGKGNQEAVVRFSQRSLDSLRDYLSTRAVLDGASGRPLRSLPLFARHDPGAGKKILPISTTTARAIVHQRVREALGDEAEASITPHSFRHYFVTTVLRGSGGNIKLAQELARHRNIAVTQRYAHLSDDELDRGYYEIFDAK
ncbi:MAG: tyrosine-type recombinase/integrase [Anaerolineales bacterium]|nr:tyrosine-type recombinase/integrase [Anaerolineales bacterium]